MSAPSEDRLGCRGPAARAWLSEVVSRQMGGTVTIAATQKGWSITRPGSERAIRLPAFFHRLSPGQSDIPFVTARGLDKPALPDLALPGLKEAPAQLWSIVGADLEVAYDVPGLVFWCLTRAEEHGRDDDHDSRGRLPSTTNHAARHGYLDRPIVDEWLMVLRRLSECLWPGAPAPAPAPRLQVSHDVDRPTRYGFTTAKTFLRRIAGDMLRGAPPRQAFQALRQRQAGNDRLHPHDPANWFEWIMDCSDAQNVTSAFYFITEPDAAGIDPRYPFDSPAIRALLRRIHARGHEIGLHPSYGSFNVPGKIASEATTLRQICEEEGIEQSTWGGRMHYLQWRADETWRAWAEAGMDYDATVGYADSPGFRCGTCVAYPVFDIASNRALPLQERPLIVMEQTLMGTSLAHVAQDPGARAMALIEAAHRVGGTFSLLWHNDVFKIGAERDLYQSLLARAASLGDAV